MSTRGAAAERSTPTRLRTTRTLPETSTPGVADALLLPNDDLAGEWDAIILPKDAKARLARQAATSFVLRPKIPQAVLPLHGIIFLVGAPGTGKTTLARGLADRVAQIMKGMGDFVFVQVDPHGLTSSSMGRTQKAVDQLLRDQVAQWAEEGPTIILLDEVETLAADRSRLSLEANPIDVHRATDAALAGLDHVAHHHRNVLFVATSNFPRAVDTALTSRADFVYELPMPGPEAREAILRSTVDALAAEFDSAGSITRSPRFREVVVASDGLDGRRLRKAVAAACAVRADANADPNNLTLDDVLTAVIEAKRGEW
jgi:pachytene checkpoint protein 2